MMVVYIAEKHLFCTLRKEKEKKKRIFHEEFRKRKLL